MSNKKDEYDKMEEYIISLFNVFQMINKKAEQKQDKKIKMIALVIFNYVKYMSKEYDIDLKILNEQENINLIPVFEYIASKNIELYDFSNIDINDVDVSKKEDLERFVLTHVYYITQK
jgi:hypothetical protein